MWQRRTYSLPPVRGLCGRWAKEIEEEEDCRVHEEVKPGLERSMNFCGQVYPAIEIMGKNRLEAFSDGVMAIIITIMVLELKAPNGVALDALKPLLPVFFSYLFSYIYVAIYRY